VATGTGHIVNLVNIILIFLTGMQRK